MHSDQKNRLMSLDFSRYMLNRLGGFNKQIFLDILKALPDGTNIRGFAEAAERDVYRILISHDSFPELHEGYSYPRVDALVNKHVSMSGEETFTVALDWPKEYKEKHDCQYSTYHGFNVIEEICMICGAKK